LAKKATEDIVSINAKALTAERVANEVKGSLETVVTSASKAKALAEEAKELAEEMQDESNEAKIAANAAKLTANSAATDA
ncbi:hypothetical protein, partial [Bartonella sp. AA89HNZF]